MTGRAIPLTKGYVAIIDEADYPLIADRRWHALVGWEGNIYAVSAKPTWTGMHRLLLGAQKGQLVDHINGDGLDNRRSNLRIATHSGNSRNRRGWSQSGFKGVYPSRARFVARIKVNGKQIHLGTFESAEEAARAYDRAALAHDREFAVLNFPEAA